MALDDQAAGLIRERHNNQVAHAAHLSAIEHQRVEYLVRLAIRTELLHDVGKVCLPEQVLLKPGSLTDAELAVMRRHSKDGADLIDHLKDPALSEVANAVGHTHERWDGSGYPAGLTGEHIRS